MRFAAKNEVTIEVTEGGPARLDFISIATNKPRSAPDLHAATIPAPQYVHNITSQNLHAHGAADMVIVIPTSQKLRQEAERLKAFHEKHDGMRVRIVPADELYNEFASGTPDAQRLIADTSKCYMIGLKTRLISQSICCSLATAHGITA